MGKKKGSSKAPADLQALADLMVCGGSGGAGTSGGGASASASSGGDRAGDGGSGAGSSGAGSSGAGSSGGSPPSPESAGAPVTREGLGRTGVTAALTALYEAHAPVKLADVGGLVDKYCGSGEITDNQGIISSAGGGGGREVEMWRKLERKYGAPAVETAVAAARASVATAATAAVSSVGKQGPVNVQTLSEPSPPQPKASPRRSSLPGAGGAASPRRSLAAEFSGDGGSGGSGGAAAAAAGGGARAESTVGAAGKGSGGAAAAPWASLRIEVASGKVAQLSSFLALQIQEPAPKSCVSTLVLSPDPVLPRARPFCALSRNSS